ncbi:MAG: lipopolysaccharide kinase [Methylococcales symbiont of Iophon sp. n. MRB-2018]|nr:MAG: lipopolysaccharide kinase [Methylococcales symbiont of Iophon sp. n. MRB-2018]KAF3980425.1 MAG: lipopolysaccharide kinase [Methylococcales symbiont of Iophon sp. n. MRB-2018]
MQRYFARVIDVKTLGKLVKEYKSSVWESILKLNDLEDFDAIWALKADWFEGPNIRRGGWSGVSRIRLNTEDGGSVAVFLKRQENHNAKSWLSRLRRGIPTFYREFKNIRLLTGLNIPTLEIVYFYYRHNKEGKSQAILITKELEGFESLAAESYSRNSALMQDKKQREKLMAAVAMNMGHMHSQRIQHRCFYDKHVFVASINDCWEVRFIDLEKVRRTLTRNIAMERDLYTFSRRMKSWRLSDKIRFFKMYMKEEKLSSYSKAMWYKIVARLRSKGKI